MDDSRSTGLKGAVEYIMRLVTEVLEVGPDSFTAHEFARSEEEIRLRKQIETYVRAVVRKEVASQLAESRRRLKQERFLYQSG